MTLAAVTAPSARIETFRVASRARGAGDTCSPRRRHQMAAFFELYPEAPFPERYARALAHALEHEPVHLFDDERLVGMLYQIPRRWEAPDEAHAEAWAAFDPWQQMAERQQGIADPFVGGGGAPGHIGWRWDRLLDIGVEGHIEDLEARLARAVDDEARQLLEGALILWRGVLAWNDRHVVALRRRAETATGSDRERLEDLIGICMRVPRQPPRTFHEAVQFFHVQHLAVMFENPFGGNGPGCVDRFLWPYLERDLQAGRITLDGARELIDELWIRFHERLQNGDGWVEAVVPGGTHADGTCAVNPLSHIMIESIVGLEQTHPVVYPRLCRDCPEAFVDLVVMYLLEGQNRAQVYNDDACIPAIVNGGVNRADASLYMAGGCMEISPQGMHSDMNFARTHNVAKVLELVLNGGADLLTGERRIGHDRDLTDYASFADLYAAFETELTRQFEAMGRALDVASETYADLRPCYLLSSLVDDCLERGREQQAGGARYHDYGFAPLGISSAAASLSGIERAVFAEGYVTPQQMLAALRADFVGHEALRARQRRLPMFGVEDPAADAMMARVLRSVCTRATQVRTRFGGGLKPMIFNFVWTPTASAELGARGDGARAGEMIGHGVTPLGRAMREGITAAINSSTALPLACVTGGATTMWDMDAEWIDHARMRAILTTFIDGGGMIFQGNTTSVAQLEEALLHPEEHADLIVRVGGFSARFASLGADLQREIIERRRHAG